MSLLTLYHGSKSGLDGQICPSSRATCDFGKGFYMGDDSHQPQTLICRAAKPKLYQLEFDTSELVCRDLGSDALWALFVALNRGAMLEYADTPLFARLRELSRSVDVFSGRIANDRVFVTVQMFLERTITLETLSEVLKAVNPGCQYCAVTSAACSHVRVVSERQLTTEECARLWEKSELQRHRAVELTNRIVDARRRADGIFFDELCEKYASGEGIC